jgi:hypothetical protein
MRTRICACLHRHGATRRFASVAKWLLLARLLAQRGAPLISASAHCFRVTARDLALTQQAKLPLHATRKTWERFQLCLIVPESWSSKAESGRTE